MSWVYGINVLEARGVPEKCGKEREKERCVRMHQFIVSIVVEVDLGVDFSEDRSCSPLMILFCFSQWLTDFLSPNL